MLNIQNDGGDPAVGYSGIEVFVSSNGADFTAVYAREEMFGAFERSATFETPADDSVDGKWTTHAFSAVAPGVTAGV